MVKRMIVKIDEEKCTGCGKCIAPCAEGAIQIINGKAKVLSEELCDGMGFCVSICPEGESQLKKDILSNLIEKKQKLILRKKDISIQCFSCGVGENTNYLLPLRHKMESLWVCTHCLPKLIHG